MRIFITGCSGSGKTTLAKRLGERRHIPVFELDDLLYAKKYSGKRPREESKRLLGELLETHDAWIMEGTSMSWTQDAVSTADIVISMQPGRPRMMLRVTKRYLSRKLGHDPYDEKLRDLLSLIKFIWQYGDAKHPYRQRLHDFLLLSRGERVVLKTRADIERFIARFAEVRQ